MSSAVGFLSIRPLPLPSRKAGNPKLAVNVLLERFTKLYDFPLVKFIASNRLLPWISRNFRLRAIYMIIRHRCAIIASQLATGIGVPKLSLNELKKLLMYEVLRIRELSQPFDISRKIDQIYG